MEQITIPALLQFKIVAFWLLCFLVTLGAAKLAHHIVDFWSWEYFQEENFFGGVYFFVKRAGVVIPIYYVILGIGYLAEWWF